ncbi:hypothetical protein PAXRUDRAFT_18133 [Paxillus rubicundulus Ve08.2h10]|uniref:Uncharacterized protein n=1 Tax=Paxillus rubicundulus Ve08.2h10 TaxID=930991 RepID=A0A0D0CZ61_9AGAM|nr:hypothetical protein PAXRUDRAFT_18133 [Paxillus rubicundulus Ve08.2h10]
MAAQPLDIQQQVYAGYWHVRLAITKLILDIECAAFNRKLLDDELSPAWDTMFNKGRTDLNFPMHLLSIIIKLKPTANNGTLQGIDTTGILPDNPQAKQSKVYIKGYTVANNTVTGNLPISDNWWSEPFHQRYVAAMMENADRERMVKKKEVQKAAATLQAAADEILQKKMARAEEEQRKAEEMKTKGTGSRVKKQGEKQVEKQRTKKIGCSILGTSPEVKTAKGKVLQSKDALQEQGMRVKPATKSKRPECSKSRGGRQIARPGVAAAKDVEMHLPKGPKAVKAKTKAKQTSLSPDDMNEDMLSGEEPEALRDPSATQPKGHKVTKVMGKGKARQPSPNAMDEDSSSEESEPLGKVFIPWVDKGKGREIPLASSIPGPSVAEVNVVEHCTTILVNQLTKQLANMRSWETASNEMDQMADAEDLEHVALKACLAELEQERMAMTAESAQARVMITNLRSMYTGGPGGIPPSALGGQAGLSQ